MIRRPPRSTLDRSSAASDVYKRQIQGWVMDVDRLKSGGSVLTDDFFERQLEKIREIRLSERKFYQKITDIYATALDYDQSATATKRFFAAAQNQLPYACLLYTSQSPQDRARNPLPYDH